MCLRKEWNKCIEYLNKAINEIVEITKLQASEFVNYTQFCAKSKRSTIWSWNANC